MDNLQYIDRCHALAEIGRKRVGVNPLVGAVLVRNGNIIAEGAHKGLGQLHAERDLLQHFADQVEPQDTLYVNLEPCCTQGRTPPCTDILLESDIRRLVFGMLDPNPNVAGRGAAALRSAGVEVIGPVDSVRCRWLNRGFVSLQERGRPWITLKKAQTRDGQIAKPDGSPWCITSDEQNTWSHWHLRRTHDAILVGVETVRVDNPRLTIRHTPAGESTESLVQPWRIILDPHLRIPLTSHLLSDSHADRTILIGSPAAEKARQQAIQASGARLFLVEEKSNTFNFETLWQVLTTPREDFPGIASILVEGGAATWNSFASAGQRDMDITLVGSPT